MNRKTGILTHKQYDDILTWTIFGVILGGRLGYVLFYKPLEYLHKPLEIFYIWEGGMSFHGGMLGVIIAIYSFCRVNKIRFFPVMDMVAIAAPIGLFFGRIANFINGELYGRFTTAEVGMVFPSDPLQISRHPSQLYEATLEGLALAIVLYISFRLGVWRRPRLASGLFLIGYGVFRSIAELYREPDKHLGFIIEGITMGQILSFPMILLGIYLVVISSKTITADKKTEGNKEWGKNLEPKPKKAMAKSKAIHKSSKKKPHKKR
jgi:phosphatidylglycerol:prolipoprotein diacylglycerol transferase